MFVYETLANMFKVRKVFCNLPVSKNSLEVIINIELSVPGMGDAIISGKM